METPRQLLLDTNILVHFVRHLPVWLQVREAYQPLLIAPTPAISVVSEGELRSLSLQWNWGSHKLDQMEFCLAFFDRHSIDTPDVLWSYAVLDSTCEAAGTPLGKNDLWIAATAIALGATLLTTDRDFDRLPDNFPPRIFVDPDTRSATPPR